MRVASSVISAGTERATLEAAEKNLLAKARARPDQARQVIDRVRREGVRETLDFVRRRLDELGPLGYSAAGTVLEAGERTVGISPGDRVAIAGGGFANHAEVDVVPHLLCAPTPQGVSDEDAAFATLGAIALHGFRRSAATVGATVAVIGLGLVGQLAARIALVAGCRVRASTSIPPWSSWRRRWASMRSCAPTRPPAGSADAILICASSTEEGSAWPPGSPATAPPWSWSATSR